MTKPKVKFNPVAQEYFDNPYEIYKRMRDEAPIYYDEEEDFYCLLYTSPSPRDRTRSRMPSSA